MKLSISKAETITSLIKLKCNATIVKIIAVIIDKTFLTILFFLLVSGLFSVSLGAKNKNDKEENVPTKIINGFPTEILIKI